MVSIVTNEGLANITTAWVAYSSRPRWLQWGEGSGQTVTDNTVNDVGATTEIRVSGITDQQTTTVTNDTYRVVGSIVAAGARNISELGIFDAMGSGSPPTGGNMGLYGDFTPIPLAEADAITFTIEVAFEDGS